MLGRIAQFFLWPFTRFFDPRFRGLAQQADVQQQDLIERLDVVLTGVQGSSIQVREIAERELDRMHAKLTTIARVDHEATREANELMARSLSDLLAETDATRATLERLIREVRRLPQNVDEGVEAAVDDLDEGIADLLNYAESHRGFAAQRGFWFNPPVSLRYEPGGVLHANTNERIVELPYVYRALAPVDASAAVLDVGAAESVLAYSLASLGYDVTAVDLHGYPLPHPRLQAVAADILDWQTDDRFDAVLCLGTLEHIGLGAYGEPPKAGRADEDALERLREFTRPGGRLVLTVPFGSSSADERQRSYDQPELDKLLADWSVEDLTVVGQQDELTWTVAPYGAAPTDVQRGVALITAVRG
jgi:SAM-dependent methyltransferase